VIRDPKVIERRLRKIAYLFGYRRQFFLAFHLAASSPAGQVCCFYDKTNGGRAFMSEV
jgi:hypothetical protein